MSMGLQSAITPHGSPELYPLCLAGLWLTPNEGGLALSLPWADLLLGHQESLSRRTRCQAVCREDVSWTGRLSSLLLPSPPLPEFCCGHG